MAKDLTLKEERLLAGMTQGQTARATGIHRVFISQLETGDLPLTDRRAKKVHRVLMRAIAKRAARLNAVVAGEGEHGRHGEARLRSEGKTEQPEAA